VATSGLVHGSWHGGSCWEPLIPALRARGHDAIAPDLPIDDPATSWEQRAAAVLGPLRAAGGEAVVVAHSAASGYGALVASRLEERLLVHLCPRLGQFQQPDGAPDAFRPGFPFPKPDAAGVSAWERESALDAMYGRLPREVAERLADSLRPSSPPTDEFPLKGHPDVETVLVYAAEDEFFNPEWQRFMSRELLGVEPIEIPGGHFPMAEDPESLADLLDRLACGRREESGAWS
jgi:pimeloyl-ACP methyl ester carboxylesterase